jgi:malate dehydrogenase (oxaloacetate-decarboxylating)
MALMDHEGVVHGGRPLSPEKAEFAVDPSTFPPAVLEAGADADLSAVVEAWRPTVLIGTTATAGRFDQATIEAMARISDRPLILALSNPTSACEVLPVDVLQWTEGRGLVATGSPFDPVPWNGSERQIGQANNAFVFPGLGLGAIVAEAREVTDDMLLVAARTLAAAVTADRLASGAVYPPIHELPAVARAIASAVVREARNSGFGRHLHDDEIEPAVDAAIWRPEYAPIPED